MNEITDKEFNLIKNYIKKNYGINLGNEKKSLVSSRLSNILTEKNFKDFTQYYDYLINDKTGMASKVFIDKMTTNHTFFMREVFHFEYLKETVFPYLEQNIQNKDIRFWCAGCSSGEESYTLQMLLTDYFKPQTSGWDTQLLATDISTVVLNKAFKGIYKKTSIKDLNNEWKNKYFKPFNNEFVQVVDEIKKNIVYRKFNLMQDVFPFKQKFQVIFCRNVMIYFDDQVRTKLVKKFFDVSEKGAYLFIGHSETLNNIKTDYKYVMPAVYRKI